MSFDLVVVGVGYVGLPLAKQACAAGLSVAGYDISADVVTGLAAGHSHVPDISDPEVKTMLANGFLATGDPAVLAGAGAVVICVPTGLSADGDPDLSAVRWAARTVAAHLRLGTLVVLESSSYPGTTEEVVRPILESGAGLIAGEDFPLAYSPERVDPGNRRFNIQNTPKIISGHTPLCAKHCAAFYGRFIDSFVVARGTREAEMAKLLENTYRYVNIALVNEVTMFCHQLGVDVWDVLHCAATKPFGFSSFHPGPGVGGHCIPIDPQYLLRKAALEGFSFDLVKVARKINSGMPGYVVRRAEDMLSEHGKALYGAQVLLLGMTYKPDMPDMRESPGVAVARQLLDRGADVVYHDPYVESFPALGTAVRRVDDLSTALPRADLTILLQGHRCYDLGSLARRARLLFDTGGKAPGEEVERL